ncbi:MAG: c-type cytochrome [Candidatus Omnitrophica bacterium]|nr:c-type cytochrome [Candidatus Omnitrophota bacterium]
MPKESPKLYSVDKTFVWFAIASVTLLISLILMVGQDYSREWKNWQRKFVRLKYEKTQAELQSAQEKVDKAKLESLEKELAEAHKNFKAKKPEYKKIQKEIAKLDLELTKVKSKHQDLKQYQDSYKYFIEEYQNHKDPRASEYEKKLEALMPSLEEARLKVEDLEKSKEEKEAEVNALKEEEKHLTKEIDRITQERDEAKKRLAKLKPGLVTALLNAPMIDFLRPTLQIQQVVLEDLEDDYHFTRVQKVDRCTTCHLGIDQKGFEDAPQPFKTHPKLDLFVGSDSPHSLEKFGCTVCHGGNGHSLTFKDTAHTPQNEEQEKAWEKKYHWHPLEKWTEKMLPLNHVEASCTKCHRGVVDIPQAEKLNEGSNLARMYGCFGCHKIEGFENQWKIGPGLDHINSKVTKDWIVRWLQNPKAFRPATVMPRVFHLSNTSSPEDTEKNNAAIVGTATYLTKHSTSVELEKAKKGDPKEGEQLFKNVGCLGCHSVESAGVNRFGPNLSGLGSKTTADWIFTWLKDPKHYHKDARMPNLRLSDEAAADITSYLLTLQNENFEKEPLPEVKPEIVDAMLLNFLKTRLRHEEAMSELSKMDQESKFDLLGKEIIGNQGCFGCHSIPGFEQAKQIGTELSNEGLKEVERLDFGFVPIERSRQAWFSQKLKNPRIFDQGRIREYFEKLRMPHFGFTDEEAEALTTFLLSLTQEKIPFEMLRILNLKEQEIEAGRFLISKYNCQGCHILDGKGGKVKELLGDPGLAPPPLDGEGAKVHETWLYSFLRSPSTIRPWLKFRMPTFGFTNDQILTLVKYFSNREKQEISFDQSETQPSPKMLESGKKLFEALQCTKCHQPGQAAPGLSASFLAPDLTLAKERLKPNWVVEWLKDPQKLQPGTMMPTFFPEGQTPLTDILEGDSIKQTEAIRDYLMQYTLEAESSPKKA